MSSLLIGSISYSAALIVAGHLLSRVHSPTTKYVAWLLAIFSLIVSVVTTEGESPLIRMLEIVTLQLLSMKILVYVYTTEQQARLSFLQWIAFAVGWLGMRPGLFKDFPQPPLPYRHVLIKGLSRIIAGVILLYFSYPSAFIPVAFLRDLLLLAGLSMILHFGILNLSTGVWRACGVPVSELFPSPCLSTSLKEFWGKRWNVAFSEMTALIIYRPLKSRIGSRTAIVISFLFSGLLHEIAISLPVRAGYGLPMLYFAFHAICMQLEQRSFIRRIIAHPILCHVWVFGCLLLPMPLLFHPAFVHQVLEPLRNAILSLVRLQ